MADGYTMPAGCIKVSLENGSVKYVSCQKMQSIAEQFRQFLIFVRSVLQGFLRELRGSSLDSLEIIFEELG